MKRKQKINAELIRLLKPKELVIYGLTDKVAIFYDVRVYEENDIITLIFKVEGENNENTEER